MKLDSILYRRACMLAALSTLALMISCQSKQGGSDVLATVDGQKIFRVDVEKFYQNQTAGSDQQPVGEQATIMRLRILHDLIDDEILMQRAEKLGLLATDDEVERKLNEIKSPYTQEQFTQQLNDKKNHHRRFQARSAPVPHGRESDQQGSHLKDHRHRPGCRDLLQRA